MNPPEGYRLMEGHEKPDGRLGDLVSIDGDDDPFITAHTGNDTVLSINGEKVDREFFRPLEPHVAMRIPLADVLDGRKVGRFGFNKVTADGHAYITVYDKDSREEIEFIPEELVEFCTEVLKIAKGEHMSDNMTAPDGYRLMRDDEKPDKRLGDILTDGNGPTWESMGDATRTVSQIKKEAPSMVYFRKLDVAPDPLTDVCGPAADRELIANLKAENERLKAEIDGIRVELEYAYETWLDRMAGNVLNAVLRNYANSSHEGIAKEAYMLAAAMLAEKQRRKGK